MYTAESAKLEADYHNNMAGILKDIDRQIYQAAAKGDYDVFVTVPENLRKPILNELFNAHYTYNSVLVKQFEGNGVILYRVEIHIFWGAKSEKF
jgi:hypothetical protein